jgi:KDO II ethanolaminephosphotransferase
MSLTLVSNDPPQSWRPVLLAVLWVGLLFNLPVLKRRIETDYATTDLPLTLWGIGSELALVLGFAALMIATGLLLGRWGARLLGGLILLVSAACAYYMTVFNVVIGYGVMSAVMTTDHDMSGEMVGLGFAGWWLVLGLLPAVWWWRHVPPCWWHLHQRRGALGRLLATCLLAALVMAGASKSIEAVGARRHAGDTGLSPSLPGVAAHAYVPSNWIAGLGMVASQAWTERQAEQHLVDPAERYTYLPSTALDDLVVVFVIGETARYDRFGLFGHARDTTPRLSAETGLVGFAGRSCNTSTKLSLACMFVRPESIQPGPGLDPDVLTERGIFSVYKKLGFRIDLFAMQGEAGFYNHTRADYYKLRELIAAQPENAGRAIDDMLLVPELAHAVHHHAAGSAGPHKPQLVILHTKGSHYLYSQRYPRGFARWAPECLPEQASCSRDELFNAFDNSVLYTDHVLQAVRDTVRDRRALVIYATDHGESIDEQTHFHATPKRIAPPEQFRIPLVFWASDKFLADPVLAQKYARLSAHPARQQPEQAGHHNLFASMLGCIGIDSPDGGITPEHDLCHGPDLTY